MNAIVPDSGSFRDPRGRVYASGKRIYRTVEKIAAADFDFMRANPAFLALVNAGRVLGFESVDRSVLGEPIAAASHVVEQPHIPFVSYPYEWTFSALKHAALLHLDVQMQALEGGIALSDATAYNIQYRGPDPVFIDLLSFRRYAEGEIWTGHRQFCEQFLNPLLLQAKTGVLYNAWYRGAQEGIPAADLRRVLPWRSKLSANILLHVVAQSALQKSSAGAKMTGSTLKAAQFPKASYMRMLQKLHAWIRTLQPLGVNKTVWQDYAGNHSYESDEVAQKKQFISEFAAAVKPDMLWDIGCNTGDYSAAALDGGARYVVGFDFDAGALESAFARARAGKLNFLPLMLDGANPSSGQGWNEHERKGLGERATADAIVALAYIHHIAIARNVPLDDLVDWLIRLAPQGVIEFVPKQDPMVVRLLQLREDIFPNYTEEHFIHCINKRARIVAQKTVTQSGRKLVWYERAA